MLIEFDDSLLVISVFFMSFAIEERRFLQTEFSDAVDTKLLSLN